MHKITAIIPAAGCSARLGLYKPLLRLGSSLIIEKPIAALREAGIEDIRLIVGHKAHLLLPLLERLGVRAIFNEHFRRGMYTSIQKGVSTLEDDIAAFFLLPADYAFVKPETLYSLLQTYDEKSYDVIYPVFKEKRGHPPLISASYREMILSEEPEGGLEELLKRAQDVIDVSVNDEGILRDMDSEEDYLKMIDGYMPIFPTRKECLRILQEYQHQEEVVAHILAVTSIAETLAEYLNSKGMRIHLGVVMAASLLHDIAKGEKNHARKGQEIINALGYPEIADIIGTHMEIDPEKLNEVNEKTIVYLADKMVSGDKLVSFETRLKMRLEKYKDEEARQIIRKRVEQAVVIKKNVENILGQKIEDILSK